VSSHVWEHCSAASITDEEARAAMLEHVSQHCCYGKGAAEQMTITNITPSNALHVGIISYFLFSYLLFDMAFLLKPSLFDVRTGACAGLQVFSKLGLMSHI